MTRDRANSSEKARAEEKQKEKKEAIEAALVEHELDPGNPTEQQTRAILQLFRCLAIGKAIAVVGSGASLIYGYDDWDGLVSCICELLRDKTKRYAVARESERDLDNLVTVLKNDSKRRKSIKIKSFQPLFEKKHLLTRDDKLAICDAIMNCLSGEGRKELENDIAERFKRSTRYKYSVSSFNKHPLKNEILSFLEKLPGNNRKHCKFISPDIGALLDALPVTDQPVKATTRKSSAEPSADYADTKKLINAPRNYFDPLSELRNRIGIHRFATFNYDLEIEALLEDLDYPYDELTRARRAKGIGSTTNETKRERTSESRIGGTAHSISLSAENASDLITIAAVPASANDLVVHVHGDAACPANMVITPSHYNAMYYESHAYRKGFEDARSLLFGGNAIIYIGFGLSEEDLMRPLRYLSANLRNRPLFALIPQLENESRSQAFELHVKAHFGVNVITYGRSYDSIPQVWKQTEPDQASTTAHPLQKYIKNDESVDKKFISLGDEIDNIHKAFSLDKERPTTIKEIKTRVIAGLRSISDRSQRNRFPRLWYSANETPVIPAMAEIALKGITRRATRADTDQDRTEHFVRMLVNTATTVALNNALEYMQEVSNSWQGRLKLSKPFQEKQTDGVGWHYGAVHQNPNGLPKINLCPKDDAERTAEIIGPTAGSTGANVVRFETGKGKGTFFSNVKKISDKANARAGKNIYRVVNLDYTMRGTVVLSNILHHLEVTSLLCFQNADCLLDVERGQPSTIFHDGFLKLLRKRLESATSGSEFRLVLIVKSRKAEEFYASFFFGVDLPATNAPRTIHTPECVNPNDIVPKEYRRLSDEIQESRWAYLAIRGACNTLKDVQGYESFLGNCERLLNDRVFSIDRKHRQSAFCEILLEERHRLIQRSMDVNKRNDIIIENIILKWMYAIFIPIDRKTIESIPELADLQKNKTNTGHVFTTKSIGNAISALLSYRFIFQNDYEDGSSVNGNTKPTPRYVLHGAVRQLLGYRRGLTFDSSKSRDNNPISLSLMLMDGGPMLSAEDFSSSHKLYEALIACKPDKDNRVALRSAYALLRGSLYTQSAMRAGIPADTSEYTKSALHTHLRRLARFRSISKRFSLAERDSTPVLYPQDELWLLNELGVVRYIQGNFHDATFAFRESLEWIDRMRVGDKTLAEIDHSLKPRLSINLALCLIERARFHDASSLVDKALHALQSLKSAEQSSECGENDSADSSRRDAFGIKRNPEFKLLRALLLGCRAQIQLLTAELDSARNTVKKALPIIESLDTLGAQAWLHSVQASAALASENYDEANAAMALALAAARGSHRPDLILNLELSAIDIGLHTSGYSRELVLTSLTRLENLEHTARQLGSHRSRVSALLIRSRALLTIEQLESARESIIELISIAQLNGMRLKRISGLTLLVALMAQRGEIEPAKRLLVSVKLAANRARYVRAVADIERLQQAIEIDGGVPQWAGFVSDFGSTERGRPQRR